MGAEWITLSVQADRGDCGIVGVERSRGSSLIREWFMQSTRRSTFQGCTARMASIAALLGLHAATAAAQQRTAAAQPSVPPAPSFTTSAVPPGPRANQPEDDRPRPAPKLKPQSKLEA